MNYNFLEIKLKEYLSKIKEQKEIENEDLLERKERELFYASYTKEKILAMEIDDFYEYISKLWAMIIWGNKHYIIDKYIKDNGFVYLKEQIVELLYGKDNLELRFDNAIKNIKGFGAAIISELLCYTYPEDCMIWNVTSRNAYKVLGIKNVPKYDYQLNGEKYVEMIEYAKQIKKFIYEKMHYSCNLLFVDYFFWDSLRLVEVDEENNKKPVESSKDKKSLHKELQEKLKDIGYWLGFDTAIEVKVDVGAVVDVVWDFSINNIGKVTYIFEIQVGGSINSLIMNLLKAAKYKNVQGIIAVSDKKQLEIIKRESDSLFRDSNLKLQFWEQEEVIDIYEKLQFVNESVNKILHIEDSL